MVNVYGDSPAAKNEVGGGQERTGRRAHHQNENKRAKNQEDKNGEGNVYSDSPVVKNEVVGGQERRKKSPPPPEREQESKNQEGRSKNQEEGGIRYLSRQPKSGKGRMAGRHDTSGRTTTTHGEQAMRCGEGGEVAKQGHVRFAVGLGGKRIGFRQNSWVLCPSSPRLEAGGGRPSDRCLFTERR